MADQLSQSGRESGVLAFLFTDIEGSVRLWERDPARMAALLTRHRRVIAAAVAAHGGTLVRERGEGDSTFSVYPKPGDAAAAAAALQRGLWAEPWPPDMGLRVRAALHVGTAYTGLDAGPDGDHGPGDPLDFNSPTVNRCARLRALAHGGQTLLSGAAVRLIREDGRGGDAPVRDLGTHRLRDLRRPERVFQLLYPPLPDRFPPLVGTGGRAGNLPHPVSPLVGRDAELASLTRLLSPEGHGARLVTLTGLGGVGKTRLAQEAARAGAGLYPDGAWQAEAGAGGPWEALAAALAVPPEAGRGLEETLTEWLADRRCLLLLDGCDRARAACARLAERLTRACGGVTVLATCQSPLGAAGERVVPLGPLAPPAGDAVADVEGSDAARLFLERAAAASPGFALTGRSARDVAAVCRRVDGLPLGLELAAACLPYLGVAPLAARLAADPLTALPGLEDAGDGGDGPRSLLGVLDQSYALLPPAEQALLRRLAVFEGGWTLEAAGAVCADPDGAGDVAAPVVSLAVSLARRSLAVRDEAGGVARYRLPRVVGLYARRRLAEAGPTEGGMSEARAAHRRHRAHFAALARRAGDALAAGAGDEAADWLDALEEDRGNLSAALADFAEDSSFAGDHPGEDDADGDALRDGLAMAVSLYPFWSRRGGAREGRALIGRLLARGGAADTPEGARALAAAGALDWGRGDFAGARAAFAQAGGVYERAGDALRAADMRNNRGNVAWDEGDFAGARALFTESLAAMEALGDDQGLASVCGNLACLCLDTGDPDDLDRAGALLERALALDRGRGDLWGVATSLDGLGAVSLRRGDGGRARALCAEALALRRRIGDRVGVAESLESLAAAHAAGGRPAAAARLLGAAERRREETESPPPPRQRAERTRLTESLRAALPDLFEAAWARGRAMTDGDADLDEAGAA